MTKTGSFDLNFPGATIICDTPQKRASLLRYLEGDADSIDVDLSRSNFEEDVANAIYNTTYLHEGKHFHDHLLCPYLLHNYTLKLFAFYYANLAIYAWNSGTKPYKWLPLPFSNWLKTPLSKKKELIEKKGIKESDVPMFSHEDALLFSCGRKDVEDEFTKNLLLGGIHYCEYLLNNGHITPDGKESTMTIKSFTESMAFVQHLSEILIRYGNDYGGKIVTKILKDQWDYYKSNSEPDNGASKNSEYDTLGYSIYTGPFIMVNRLAHLAQIDPKHYYPFQSYTLFWALCGCLNPNSGLWSLYPRNRLEALSYLVNEKKVIELDQEENVIDLMRHPIETFKKWNKLIAPLYKKSDQKVLDTAKLFNLEIAKNELTFEAFYEDHFEKLAAMVKKLESLGLFFLSFYIYNIADALQIMMLAFCQYPSLYLYPEAYSDHLDLFANVPFRIKYDGIDPINEKDCKLKRKGIGFVGNCLYGDSLINNKRRKVMDWRAYDSVSDYLNFTDALFWHSYINMPGALIRKYLPGLNTWFIQPNNCINNKLYI